MFTEKIGTLTKISNTQVQLTGSSVLKLGGQQRVLSNPSLSASVAGIGGLDAQVFPELIVNGTFNTDLSFWIQTAGCAWEATAGGRVVMTASGGRKLEQGINTVVGQTYFVSVDYINTTNTTGTGAAITAYTAANATGTLLGIAESLTGTGTSGTLTFSFVATTSFTYIYISAGDTNDVIRYDNVSVKRTSNYLNASSFYYVYAVYNGTNTGLVASTNSVSPTGFTRYKKVGAFYTDAASNIFKAYRFGELNQISLGATVNIVGSATSIATQGGATWLASTSTYVSGNVDCVFASNIFSVVPSIVAWVINVTGANSTVIEHNGIDAGITTLTVKIETASPFAAGPAIGSGYFTLAATKQGIDAIQPDWN